MPTAEQRHERALQEPDTSEIDPKTLVDVSDLPQWLQTIAARDDGLLPAPGESVEHAVEHVRAVSAIREGAQIASADSIDPPTHIAQTPHAESTEEQEVGLLSDEPATALPMAAGAVRPSWVIWSLVASGIVMVILVVVILSLL